VSDSLIVSYANLWNRSRDEWPIKVFGQGGAICHVSSVRDAVPVSIFHASHDSCAMHLEVLSRTASSSAQKPVGVITY